MKRRPEVRRVGALISPSRGQGGRARGAAPRASRAQTPGRQAAGSPRRPHPNLKAALAREGLVTTSCLALLNVKICDHLPNALTHLQRQHMASGFDRVVLKLLRHGSDSRVLTYLTDALPAPGRMPLYLAGKLIVRVGAAGQRVIDICGSNNLQQRGHQQQR